MSRKGIVPLMIVTLKFQGSDELKPRPITNPGPTGSREVGDEIAP